jgi:hypothetical protein
LRLWSRAATSGAGVAAARALNPDEEKTMASKKPPKQLSPDERPLDRLQASRLARLSGVEDRYALECWFFAPSHPSSGYLPLLV